MIKFRQEVNKKWVVLFPLIACCLFLGACKEKIKIVDVKKTYTVKKEKKSQQLYFSGELRPVREAVVAAPADATVKKMEFHYGETVKQDQILVRLSSPAQQKEYNETLTGYLKAKDQLEVQKSKYAGTKSLWEAGLVSENSYKNDLSTLMTNRVAFLQEKSKLVHMSTKFKDLSSKKVLALSLDDFDKVKAMLALDKNTIVLKAPFAGIALKPENSGSDKKVLRDGSQLKAAEVITLVGDMRGVSISIKIPEVSIDKLKAGMKAVVTGIAFPNMSLDGVLHDINAQANSVDGGSGGLPTFSATVIVPKLTPAQKKVLKVGMSTSVTIILSEKEEILIPIKAVSLKEGKSTVQVKRSSGKIETVEIEPGYATVAKVQVLKGLADGDVIVWHQKETVKD